jgi:hypothetical protein
VYCKQSDAGDSKLKNKPAIYMKVPSKKHNYTYYAVIPAAYSIQ